MKNIALFLLLVLASCSTPQKSMQKQKKSASTKAEVSKSSVKKTQSELDLVAALDMRVAEAKKEGKEKVKLLSGELFLKASDASFRSDYKTSILYFNALLKLTPNEPYLKKRFAIELIKVGRYGEAKEELEKLYKSHGNYSNIGLILGGIYSSIGEAKKSEKVYKEIISDGGEKMVEACIFLVKSYQISKKLREAKVTLKRCGNKTDRKDLFLYYEGKIALQEGHSKKAKKLFKRSLKLNPRYYPAVIELGKVLETDKKSKEAYLAYKKYLERDPAAYPVLRKIVNVLLKLNNKKEAIPYVETLTRIDPTDLNLKLRLGLFYIDVKRYDESKSIFRELLQEVPSSAKVLFYLGVLHKKTKDYDKAISYFEKIKKNNIYFKESIVQISNILMEKAVHFGQKDIDHEIVKKFILYTRDKSKEFQFLKLELGSIIASFYETIRDYKKAIEALSSLKSEEGFGENHEYYLASLYEKNKNYKKAREIIEMILDKNPENPHALNFLGYSMLEKNENLPQAFIYIKKAVRLRPNDGYIRDSLGWFYYKTGKINKALKEIKKAWDLVKSDFVIAKHLATIYLKKRNYALALKFYREAMKASKTDEERREVAGLIKNLQDRRNVVGPKRIPASN
tara:strand:+ start:1359 stop:3233 length:1875 start_codon:yes stop_codon:yes gene_type:complete